MARNPWSCPPIASSALSVLSEKRNGGGGRFREWGRYELSGEPASAVQGGGSSVDGTG